MKLEAGIALLEKTKQVRRTKSGHKLRFAPNIRTFHGGADLTSKKLIQPCWSMTNVLRVINPPSLSHSAVQRQGEVVYKAIEASRKTAHRSAKLPIKPYPTEPSKFQVCSQDAFRRPRPRTSLSQGELLASFAQWRQSDSHDGRATRAKEWYSGSHGSAWRRWLPRQSAQPQRIPRPLADAQHLHPWE